MSSGGLTGTGEGRGDAAAWRRVLACETAECESCAGGALVLEVERTAGGVWSISLPGLVCRIVKLRGFGSANTGG